MSGRNFTERVRQTLAAARERAVALNHEYVGTEHILLALLESDGVGATALQNLNVDLRQTADMVMSTVRRSPPELTQGPDAPYTSRSKKVLELAIKEADAMKHSYVGTEHLLLGLLAEGHGIAAQVLHQLGVRLDGGRQRVLAIVGGRGPTRVVVPDDVVHRGVREAVAPPRDELPTSIDVTLRYSNGAVVRRSFTNRGDTTKFLSSIRPV